jgi:GNAT superfamily N-acetyltransferase
MRFTCFECGQTIAASDLAGLGDAFVAHARSVHDWPYPEQGIRNYAEATQRLTGGSARLDAIDPPEIHPVTKDRLDDWRRFFDHDAFVATPEWASCYCLAPHPGRHPVDDDPPHWTQSRDTMTGLLTAGGAFGYLAYVSGRVAGWVNASKRSQYSGRFQPDDGLDPEFVIGITCFVIAPPYRRHGIAAALLDRVVADAPERGGRWVEAYPYNDSGGNDAHNYRGPRSMYERRGFQEVEIRERDTILRREV